MSNWLLIPLLVLALLFAARMVLVPPLVAGWVRRLRADPAIDAYNRDSPYGMRGFDPVHTELDRVEIADIFDQRRGEGVEASERVAGSHPPQQRPGALSFAARLPLVVVIHEVCEAGRGDGVPVQVVPAALEEVDVVIGLEAEFG